jgi:hypothetical protein
MPRKKDGMKFELLPRPTKGEDGKPLLYAHPAVGRKWSMRTLDDFCNKYRGMSKGEVTRVFEMFMEVAAIHMEDGSRIETPFGSFAPKLKVKGDFTDPAQVKHDDVYFAGIEFIPSKRFVQELNNRLEDGFLKVTDQYDDRPEPDEETTEAALQKCLSRGYVTIKSFAYYSGMKYDMAKRYLNKLCEGETPRLHWIREGRMRHYFAIEKKKAE